MKIGIIYDSSIPNVDYLSANDRRVFNICKSLNLVGISAEIMQPHWRNKIDSKSFDSNSFAKIITIGKICRISIFNRYNFYLECFKFIKYNKYDYIIFYNTIIDSVILMIALKLSKIKFGLEICDKHSENKVMKYGLLNNFKRLLIILPTEWLLNKITDFNIVINNSLRQLVPSQNLLLLPVLVDNNQFEFNINSSINFKTLNGLNNDLIITFCGSYWYYEGSDLLLEAIRLLSLKYNYIKLLFVGNISVHNYKPDLLSLVNRYGLSDFVYFTGKLPEENLIEAFSATDIFVLPQIKDGFTEYAFPTIIGEYASIGKAIVASDTGELSSVFTDQKNILFFENQNVEHLVFQIEKLILDKSLRDKIGEGAKAISQNIFGLKINGLKMFNFFHNL